MSKTITPEILIAYAQCPRKAFLLMCTETDGTPHEYIKILEKQRQKNQGKYLDLLQKKSLDVQPYSQDALKDGNDFLINASLVANGLAADCAILTKVKTPSTLGRYSYEPIIFTGTYNIKEEQKLELIFVGYVLEQIQNRCPVSGKIIGLNEKSYNVKLENSTKILIPLIEPLQEWAATSSPEPPSLILNKYCSICQFQNLCRAKAEQENNLSLLDGISTPKAINKYEKKGLFTVKQLSYTFKPRKRKKRTKNPPSVTHKLELQALALREGKIYLEELPELTRQPVELFLDIEGVPDQQLYYLIGLLVCENNITTYHPFWANTPEDEAKIWRQFLAKASQHSNAPIYHYGNFEPRALAKLAKQYDTDDNLINRLINANRYIFGKVYFPVYSNRLKDLGNFIGATWSSTGASGLQSLVWWHYWDETHDDEYKHLLLTYNQDDCRALKLLIDELSKIRHSAGSLSQVDFASHPTQRSTEVAKRLQSQFRAILDFAHFDYDKKKIKFRQENEKDDFDLDTKSVPKKVQKKPISKVTRIIEVQQGVTCPKCGYQPLRPTERKAGRVIVDLVLTKNGIKKTVSEYKGFLGYCPDCGRYYSPPEIRKYGRTQLYGRGLMAWAVYQRVALRLPYESITESLEEHFSTKIEPERIVHFIKDFSDYYAQTEKRIAQRMLDSAFVHVDETRINIGGTNWYVWVFTDNKHVILKLSETRETTIVHEMLGGYEGILISDFYAGYDAVKCKQQKCWVHLIRDLNKDLRDTPFDTEYENFVLEIRDLIIPIMETIQKYGLKQRNLAKFKKSVDSFYKKMIIGKRYKSELVNRYQKRFVRYKDDLFTFLEHDGIPWHNNTAERAIRHIAKQRAISTSLGEQTTRDYLVLLSIRQTCRFQNKSFFKLLFSGERELDNF